MRLARHLFALGFLAASTLAACQLLVGIEDERGVARPDAAPPDAAVDDAGVEDPCVKRHPPPPPSGATGEAKKSFVFAVRSFTTRTDAGAILGYDLDDRCTGTPGSTTADAPCVSPGETLIVDGENGIDNALVGLSESFGVGNDAGEGDDLVAQNVNGEISSGYFTNLIGLFDYNGLPNDDEVRVRVVPGVGPPLVSNEDGGAATNGPPLWDGNDTWNHTADDISPGDPPVWGKTIKGYVVDDVLVVPARGNVAVGLLGRELLVSGGVLTARMVREGGEVRGLTGGIIAGRALADHLLQILAVLSLQEKSICEHFAPVLQEVLCGARDIPFDQKKDGQGLACDAISLGFGFEAAPARLGAKGQLPTLECDAALACTD